MKIGMKLTALGTAAVTLAALTAMGDRQQVPVKPAAAAADTLPSAAGTVPLGSVFTYQGRLTQSGVPVNEPVDLVFRLYAALSGGSPIDTESLPGVNVEDGLVTVQLDFGAAAFDGSERWLEIEVDGDILSPRQLLRAAPYALFALGGNEGPQGEPGPQGDPGDPGPPGPPGTTSWTGLTDIPAGFADNMDNDSGGDITGVMAGAGLIGGAVSGDAAVSLSSVGAAPGETLKWTGAAFDWQPDNNTTYMAGQGLQLSGTTFSLAPQGATPG
jgi:hypothetical protein